MHNRSTSETGVPASRQYALRLAALSVAFWGLMLVSLFGGSNELDETLSPAFWICLRIGIPIFLGIVGAYLAVRGTVHGFVGGFSTILLIGVASHALLALLCGILLLTPG